MKINVAVMERATGTVTQITIQGTRPDGLAVGESHVAWVEDEQVDEDIYLADLETGAITPIANSDVLCESGPDMSDGKLVWMQSDGVATDIVLHDMASGTTRVLTDGTRSRLVPRVGGDWIVWDDFTNRIDDIFAYRISDGRVVQLTDEPSTSQRGPDTDGNTVVWGDSRGDGSDIGIYDLETERFRLVERPGAQGNVRASGRWIIYEDARGAPSGVTDARARLYVYDLVAEKEYVLPAVQPFLRSLDAEIHGNRVVWRDGRAPEDEPYAFDLKG
ncbi:MAG: TolB family protein [Gemmatimonadota bacterium]